jgi:hypothetical protein
MRMSSLRKPIMDVVRETAPGPLPRPPNQPPSEPIIIRTPPGPLGDLEIATPDDADHDHDAEIRRRPQWIPDRLPPTPPEHRVICR